MTSMMMDLSSLEGQPGRQFQEEAAKLINNSSIVDSLLQEDSRRITETRQNEEDERIRQDVATAGAGSQPTVGRGASMSVEVIEAIAVIESHP